MRWICPIVDECKNHRNKCPHSEPHEKTLLCECENVKLKCPICVKVIEDTFTEEEFTL